MKQNRVSCDHLQAIAYPKSGPHLYSEVEEDPPG